MKRCATDKAEGSLPETPQPLLSLHSLKLPTLSVYIITPAAPRVNDSTVAMGFLRGNEAEWAAAC